jgi:hypothetical protein
LSVVLTVEPVLPARVDELLSELAWIRLSRLDGLLTAECAEIDRERAAYLLARAGTRTRPADAAHARPAGSLPASLAGGLAPVAVPGVLDVVDIRAVLAGEATRCLARRRWPWQRRGEQARVRAVLRGDDRLLAFRRLIWATPARLRSGALRAARPFVFDRSAHSAPERFALGADDELTRWLSA